MLSGSLSDLDASCASVSLGERGGVMARCRWALTDAGVGMMQGIIDTTGNERFAYDTYRRFLNMYSDVVMDLDKEPFEEVRAQLLVGVPVLGSLPVVG